MRVTRLTPIAGALSLLAGLAALGYAQDPLKLYPENYTLLHENDEVRVLEFRLAKGATETTHQHPANVAIFLTDVNIRFTLPNGEKRMRVAKAGEVSYSGPTAHASENIGSADARGIIVELKRPAAMPGAAPSTPDEITAATLIHGLVGKEEDLKRHLLSLAPTTRAEPGAIRYDLYQSPERPSEFMRLEVWSSDEALEAHKGRPHLRASFEKRQREGWSTEIMVFKRVPEDAMPAAWIERLDPRLDALIPAGVAAEVVADGIEWAEGPLWDTRSGSLLFSDVPQNAVFRWTPGLGVEPVLERSGYTGPTPFAGREPGSNGLTYDREGRLVFCRHGDRSIARLEHDGRITVLADRYNGKRLNSPNDLAFGPDGALYFTDPPFGLPKSFDDPAKELPFQGVYRLSADGKLTLLTRELDAPNGIGLSPDGETLYVANAYNARPIWMAFPVKADGSLGAGRQFAEARAYVAAGEGVPDGLKVDAQGNLFAAGPGGVHIYAPDGTRLGRIVTGVPTGNLAWGEDGSVLYVAANHRILRLRTTTRGMVPGPRLSASGLAR